MSEIEVAAEVAAFDEFAKGSYDYFSDQEYTETLTETDALEVLAQEADGTEEVIIYAWKRKAVSEEWRATTAGQLYDRLIEAFDDEDCYGPLDDSTSLPAADEAAVKEKARELVDFFVKRSPVWQCDQVAECALSAEAVRAIFEREGI